MSDRDETQLTVRTPVHELAGADLLDQLRDELPSYALEHLDPAFIGHDEVSASRLVSAAPNAWRGEIALCAYLLGTPNPVYRTILRRVWDHDHGQLMGLLDQDTVFAREMIVAAEFAHPFRGRQTVYRGVADVVPEEAVKGLSWTTSYEIACWFACRFSERTPLVLTAHVHATDIIYWSDERSEREVILRSTPAVQLDDQRHRWDELAQKVGEERVLAFQSLKP